jgi:DNA-binding NarL/FixJ family response regulator
MPLSESIISVPASTPCAAQARIPVRRILIVDEHPLVCEGLRRLVEHECDLTVCGEAGSSRAARTLTKELDPDAVVIDIGLERGDGIDLVRDLRTHHPQLRILVLSAYDEGIYAERLLSVGANGYVPKAAENERFLSALRRVLDGLVSVSESIGSNMIQKLTTGGGRRTVNPVERLTTRELQIVDMIGRGMSTRETALALHLSIKTVESHRQRIRTKLHLQSGSQLLRFAVLFHSDSLSRQA